MLRLIKPTLEKLPAYRDALERGWSSDNLRREKAAKEQLAAIAADAEGFIASLDIQDPAGATVTLPDGSSVPRLPGFQRWIWDADFCGTIGMRWKPGTSELPPYCLGHIGYSIVPWQQQKGYCTRALALLLQEIKPLELEYLTITTDPENLASQKVILANGGFLVERFTPPAAYGDEEKLRFRIDLQQAAST